MMELIGYIASILIGISLGMLGGGGSILTVPVLVYFFGLSPVLASSYSLCIVGIASLSGSIGFFIKKMIDFRVVLQFGIPSITCVYISRSFLLPAIPEYIYINDNAWLPKDQMLMITFALVMIIAAIFMIRKKESPAQPVERYEMRYTSISLLPGGMAAGFITGLLGAGGGFLIIPVLVVYLNLQMKKAVGTSLVIITLNSLAGFLLSTRQVNLDWYFFLNISIVAVIGIFIGRRLSRRISADGLKKWFGIFLLAVACWVLVKEMLHGIDVPIPKSGERIPPIRLFQKE